MNQPRKKYLAANVCIYCGDRSPPLGDEHIIPFGLNGDLIISCASCKKCEKVTSRLERLCLRGMFGPYRVKQGFQTRRPKGREKPYPLNIYDKEGNKQTVDLPLAKHPGTMLIPSFDPPNILSGSPPPNPESPVNCKLLFIASEAEFDVAEAAARASDSSAVHMASADVAAFGLMLAKIGHAYAYANTNGFEVGWKPLLRKTIFEESPSFNHFVGNAEDTKPNESPDALHHLQIIEANIGDKTYCGVDIRLFANIPEIPTYRVIVAERDNQTTP